MATVGLGPTWGQLQGPSNGSLAEWDIQTEFCNFYQKNAVHPWNNLTRQICHRLDDDAFKDLITLSRNHLGDECDSIMTMADPGDRAMTFFTSLEKKYKEHVTEILLNLFSHTNMHAHSGQVKISEKIREYQTIESQYRSSSNLRPPGHHSNLFGREQLIKDCLDCLTGRATDAAHVGVVLSGLSGMGKTSLAAEVCYKLRSEDPAWQIVTVNQRGKTELRELCTDLVSSLLGVLYPGTTDAGQEGSRGFHGEPDLACLRREAMQLLREQCTNQIGRKVLLWLDDLDGHCESNTDRKQMCFFLQDITNLLHKHNAYGKVQLVLTVARKLGQEQTPMWRMNQGLGVGLRDMEVPGLTPADTEAIVRSVAGLQDKDLAQGVPDKLCELCCGSPIAIRAVADLLRDAVRVPEILAQLRCERPECPRLHMQLAKCMGAALDKLDIDVGSKESRELLAQLTVFQSAEFDVKDVLAVSQDVEDGFVKGYLKDISKAQVKVRLIEFKARHLLEISSHFKRPKKESHSYSLHPLVVKYLHNVINESKELKVSIEQAEFRFLKYFYQKIQEFTVKQNKSPVKTKFKIEDKWVHLKHFFELLLSETMSVFDLTPTLPSHKMSRKSVTVQHSRLSKLAASFLNTEKMGKFAKIQGQHARERQNYCGYIYWTCVEAENLVQREKIKLADQVFTGMASEVGESISSDVKEMELGTNVQGYQWPPVEVIPVYATYCYTRGKLNSEKKSHDRALDYLKYAESLYAGDVPKALREKIGKERISRREFRGELARVANLIGIVYFDKEDFATARDYHIKAYDTIRKELDNNVKWHEDYTEILTNWATTFHQEGLAAKEQSVQQLKFTEAMKIYSQCIEADKTMKRDMVHSHGTVLYKRAEIFYLQDDYERAITDLKKAKRIMTDKFTHPNINITLSFERMGEYLFKLGKKQKKEHKVEADTTLEAALEEFDYTLSYIVEGGLPIEYNNHRTYRICKEKHLELLKMLKKKTTNIEEKYRRFEAGYYDKTIQQNREDDFDREEFLKQTNEEGFQMELFPCSDGSDTDSSDESTSSGVTRSSSSSGDQPISMMEMPRQNTIVEIHGQGNMVEMQRQDTIVASTVEVKRQDSMVEMQRQDTIVASTVEEGQDSLIEMKRQDTMVHVASTVEVKRQDSDVELPRQNSGIASMEVEEVGAAGDGTAGTGALSPQAARTPVLEHHQRASMESLDQDNDAKDSFERRLSAPTLTSVARVDSTPQRGIGGDFEGTRSARIGVGGASASMALASSTPIPDLLEKVQTSVGEESGHGIKGNGDKKVTSQDLKELKLRPRGDRRGDGAVQRPSVRDSGLGESSEYEDKHSMAYSDCDKPRKQLLRQSSIDEPGHVFRQPLPSTGEIGHSTFPSTSQNIPQAQRPASLSVIHTSRKRSLESPGMSLQCESNYESLTGTSLSASQGRDSWKTGLPSASQRRESWQTGSPSGSAESEDDLRRSWRSSGSQESFTTQFHNFSPFQRKPSPDAFEDAEEEEEEEEEPVTKRARTSLEHHSVEEG